MYSSYTQQQCQTKVRDLLQSQPQVAISELAAQLNLSEAEVTLALPSSMVKQVAGQHAQAILERLPNWGRLTTIVHSFASIFEVKGLFPKGKLAHGYYNLMSSKSELHGHLKLDLIEHIALVSKPFMKQESHHIGFFNATGDCVFKVYLGRDKKRQLFPEQVALFKRLPEELSHD